MLHSCVVTQYLATELVRCMKILRNYVTTQLRNKPPEPKMLHSCVVAQQIKEISTCSYAQIKLTIKCYVIFHS